MFLFDVDGIRIPLRPQPPESESEGYVVDVESDALRTHESLAAG